MAELPAATSTWSYPTRFRLGMGVVAELAESCSRAGVHRPLVVTDPGLVELEPYAAVRTALERAGLAHGLFSRVRPNPNGSDVQAACEVFRSGGHDGVVALGGGSALDVGKVVALAAHQIRPLWDFEDVGDNWTRADADVIAPVIAVPTTAGTGSEVGRAGVVTHEVEARKVIVFHPAMLPVEVLADPQLTVSLPTVLTVGTGIDALSHSLEAVCAPTYHPMSEGIGMEGCRLVLEHLPRVVAAPDDLAGRTHMMAAAAMGAVAFQKGLGAMHALAHPIGARFDTHHGMTNATLMPYVLAANLRDGGPAVAAVLGRLAAYCGIAGGAHGLVDHVLELRASLEVPHTLVELGVDPGDVATIAAAAVADPSAATNPVEVTAEWASRVFLDACEGALGG